MQNDTNRLGERVARLESEFKNIVIRLDHLDNCVDDAKKQSAENFRAIEARLDKWDRRWLIGFGILIGIMILQSSGTMTLLMEIISKVSK